MGKAANRRRKERAKEKRDQSEWRKYKRSADYLRKGPKEKDRPAVTNPTSEQNSLFSTRRQQTPGTNTFQDTRRFPQSPSSYAGSSGSYGSHSTRRTGRKEYYEGKGFDDPGLENMYRGYRQNQGL